MIILYNMLQMLLLVVFSPFILLFVLCSSKYRDRVPARLGFGLRKRLKFLSKTNKDKTTFWIHALSVGETTSAEPFIRGLKKSFPGCQIVFSVTTKSGRHVADKRLVDLVDVVLDSPLDILPVVHYFQTLIQPDFFILVETDFWPNNLLLMEKKNIPTILVNGRVSEKSIKGYKRMPFFFAPMFRSFSALCMQTAADKRKMESLGIATSKVLTLGNLKFDIPEIGQRQENMPVEDYLPKDSTIFICGSTHPGEEDLLISSYIEVRKEYPELYLIIAPRNINRAHAIKELAQKYELTVTLKTEPTTTFSDLFILNTIGELSACYSICQIAFVGGSLVPEGGHNPIEPASIGIPVLFGPHMEDFSEIADSIVGCGGGQRVMTKDELSNTLRNYLEYEEERNRRGQSAHNFVNDHRGVIDKHLNLIRSLQ